MENSIVTDTIKKNSVSSKSEPNAQKIPFACFSSRWIVFRNPTIMTDCIDYWITEYPPESIRGRKGDISTEIFESNYGEDILFDINTSYKDDKKVDESRCEKSFVNFSDVVNNKNAEIFPTKTFWYVPRINLTESKKNKQHAVCMFINSFSDKKEIIEEPVDVMLYIYTIFKQLFHATFVKHSVRTKGMLMLYNLALVALEQGYTYDYSIHFDNVMFFVHRMITHNKTDSSEIVKKYVKCLTTQCDFVKTSEMIQRRLEYMYKVCQVIELFNKKISIFIELEAELNKIIYTTYDLATLIKYFFPKEYNECNTSLSVFDTLIGSK